MVFVDVQLSWVVPPDDTVESALVKVIWGAGAGVTVTATVALRLPPDPLQVNV